jgi:hypothetical protein
MKILVANGRGAALAGAITVNGAKVGDKIVGVLAQYPGNSKLEYCDDGWFESIVSVDGQVQQLLPLMRRQVWTPSGAPSILGVDGNTEASLPSLGDRPQVAGDPGGWRFVFVVEPGAVASADGAIALKEGTVTITKGSIAALTLADPTAGTDDLKRLRVISTTAFAHTLSNAAGSGFNAGGAASDVGTFGGAKGDNICLLAYGGKWYVESKVNVTLA